MEGCGSWARIMELADGSEARVRRLRQESEGRFQRSSIV